MTRVLSGAVLLIFAIALVWFAPDLVFFFVCEALVLVAFGELSALSRASGLAVPEVPSALAAVLTAAAFSRQTFSISWASLDVVLMAALVGVGALSLVEWQGGSDAVGLASAGLFPVFYLGLPFGAVVAIRESDGREALFLLILTIAVSDTAQYYSGRLFGRRPLAPAISPKKTVEGAIGGFVFGALAFAIVGHWWLPGVPAALRAGIGVAVVAVGILGDLFESMLKRSAGVKDSSALIPGHGGILDRLDALLFAAPLYYLVLKYV
jgi:phosphatidate cytidylyltransferase